ncbi:MAG TPA: MFS transporter, partial [Luteolibacter sp.]|nr:MFS transporter [Luteolibacter sp.]
MSDEPAPQEPSRRQWVGYWSMIAQQTQNAFNDKMAQFVLISLGSAVHFSAFGAKVSDLAVVLIALPFVLFAPMAGWLSDRFSKRDVMLWAAIAQIVILIWIAAAVYLHHLPAALCGFFALAVQSAFFGPAKMGINKELVGHTHLGFATGIQQMTAMLAMLVGQIIAGWWFDHRYKLLGGTEDVAWQAAFGPLWILFLTALPAVLMAWIVPRVPAQGGQRFSAKITISHFVSLRDLWSDRRLRQASFGVVFFWGVASFINLWSIKLADAITGGGEGFGTLQSLYMAAASLGMVVGFGAASMLLRRRIELGWVPLAGAAMGVSAMALAFAPLSGAPLLSLLAAFAFFAALFLAPLNAWMQDRYPADKRGELQSAVNLQDCMAGILSVAVMLAIEWLCRKAGLGPLQGLRVQVGFVALCCFIATLGILRILPAEVLRLVCSSLMALFYRIRTVHSERVPRAGGVLMVANHITFIDAFLLTVASPRPLRFVMDEAFAKSWTIASFSGIFDTLMIRRDQPLGAIREIIDALKRGEVICLFPEGQLSRTGTLGPLEGGFKLIARKAGHPIVPVWVDGSWASIFSYARNRVFTKWPRIRRLDITVAYGDAISPDEADVAKVRAALLEVSAAAIEARFATEPRFLPWRRSLRALAQELDQLDGATRRHAWINAHQIRVVNALQEGQ